MISIPIYDTIQGITIFKDDEDDARYYFLPRKLRIAQADNGDPQFTFLYYQFPLNRPDNSEPGGGYLTFTTVLEEEPNTLEDIRNQLQTRYTTEHPMDPVPRTVTLAPVDFTEGEVRLLTFKEGKFVKAINAGKPSLFGQNTASLAVELDSDGATLFHQALTQGGSVGGIEYDLTFPVRLPALTIIGRVDSKEVKEAVIGYTREKVESEDTWGNEESHEVAHRTSIAETMESQGLIHLEILKGSVTLSQEDEDSLRSFAFRMMDEFIKEHFLKGGTIETEEDRTSQWMSYLGQDITANFDLNVTYRDVINRTYSPSAQVNPSFLGAPVEDLVLEIDLQNAPWFYNTLEVGVDTNLDFDKFDDLVHSVVAHLSYDQPRPDGTRVTARDSLIFTRTDRKAKTFKTRLAEVGRDTYHVDVEVNYKSGPVLQKTLYSQDTMKRDLTLSVPNPGIMEIDFIAEPSAFDDKLQSIEVEVEYGDPRNDVPTLVETVILNKGKVTQNYKRVIYAPWDKEYRYRPTYVFKDENGDLHRSTAAWITASATDGQKQFVTIHSPFDETFSLTIIPSVDWNDVAQLIVDFDYADEGSDYRMSTTKSFSAQAAAPAKWQFQLRDPKQRKFRYSQKYLMVNNAFIEEPWQEVETDAQTLLVGNAPGGVLKLTVDPSDIGLGGTVKRAIVRLRYEDPANNLVDTQILVFRAATTQDWTVARKDASINGYTYEVEYFMADGTRSTLTGQTGAFAGINDFLFLPAPEPV